jgi:AcrR family transcriptional regulator
MKKPAPPAPDRKLRTRLALLHAATRLFRAYGFRHTTMEAIAAEAQVAKATAYGHFAHKEEVFGEVIALAAAEMIDAAEAAAEAAEDRGPEASVLASLLSKELAMYELVHRSPHASELLEAFNQVGNTQTEAAHRRYIDALGKRLARCKGVGKKAAPQVATLLDHAAYGLAARATGPEDLRARLVLMVERLVGPITA